MAAPKPTPFTHDNGGSPAHTRSLAPLYAAFPATREINPHQWDSKMMHWRRRLVCDCATGALEGGGGENAICTTDTAALSAAAHSPRAVSFDAGGIVRHYTTGGVVPLGLDTVLASMESTGDVLREGDYTSTMSSPSAWGPWLVNSFVRKPLTWALGHVVRPGNALSGRFVVRELVETAAQEILDRHWDTAIHGTDGVMPYTRFVALSHLPAPDAAHVLAWLVSSRKAAVFTLDSGEKMVKLCEAKDSVVAPPSDVDRGIARLELATAAVQAQVDKLHAEVDRLRGLARVAAVEGKKSVGVFSLKRAYAIEAMASNKLGVLANLADLLTKIQSAETDAKALEALGIGARALKLTTTSADKADRVMADVQDAFDDHNEVEEAFRTGFPQMESVDEAELEAELEALCAEQSQPSTLRPASAAPPLASPSDDTLADSLSRLTLAQKTDLTTASPNSTQRALDSAPNVPQGEPRAAPTLTLRAKEAPSKDAQVALF